MRINTAIVVIKIVYYFAEDVLKQKSILLRTVQLSRLDQSSALW